MSLSAAQCRELPSPGAHWKRNEKRSNLSFIANAISAPLLEGTPSPPFFIFKTLQIIYCSCL
jgi:hypothetical protein